MRSIGSRGTVLMRVAVINSHSPYSSANAKESLDMTMVFASFEHPPALFFCGNGIYQLLKQPEHTNAGNEHFNNLNKQFNALAFYDVNEIFVCADSLEHRGLTEQQLSLPVDLLRQQQWHSTLSTYQHIVRF